MVERKFVQKGWEVGRSEKHDFCPSCVEKQRIDRRQRRNATKPVLSVVPPQRAPVTQEQKMPSTDTMAPAPEAISRDDKRIIFARLQDVYLDETKGYMVPWTDQALAKDIGCPVAWVAQVRDDNFGPARDNSEIRDMLDRVETNAADAAKVLEEARAIRAEGAALVSRINDLNSRITPIARNLDGLCALAERIGKSVLP